MAPWLSFILGVIGTTLTAAVAFATASRRSARTETVADITAGATAGNTAALHQQTAQLAVISERLQLVVQAQKEHREESAKRDKDISDEVHGLSSRVSTVERATDVVTRAVADLGGDQDALEKALKTHTEDAMVKRHALRDRVGERLASLETRVDELESLPPPKARPRPRRAPRTPV